MLDYCMCPKCERMIMLDSDFETGFCLYCGTHISYQDSREFLLEGLKSAVPDDMKIEADLSELIDEGKATVKILHSRDKWFGVTYREDKPTVVAAIAQKTQDGLYPENLWN